MKLCIFQTNNCIKFSLHFVPLRQFWLFVGLPKSLAPLTFFDLQETSAEYRSPFKTNQHIGSFYPNKSVAFLTKLPIGLDQLQLQSIPLSLYKSSIFRLKPLRRRRAGRMEGGEEKVSLQCSDSPQCGKLKQSQSQIIMDISVVSVQVCQRLDIVITPCNIRLEDFTQ